MSEIITRSFAFIVDGEVVGTIHLPSNLSNYERLSAGLSSDPIVLEVSDIPGVSAGWVFDGQNFSQPQE